ncbi:MAG: hypothetical protein WCP93_04045 [Candidatus Berkelbacteria bacterium]
MKNIFIFFLILSFLFVPINIWAHPGKLDVRGGHICKTNCDKWGVKAGEWHKHKDVIETVKKAKFSTKTKTKTKILKNIKTRSKK